MKNIIEVISKLIIFCMILSIALAFICSYYKEHYGYEYLTMDDNFGVARHCYILKKGLYCNADGQLIEVKQFRKR